MKTLYKLDGTIATNDLLQLSDINSDSNYIKFPDGTLLQWGNASETFNYNFEFYKIYYASKTIVFPILFTNSPKAGFLSGKIDGDNGSFNMAYVYNDSCVCSFGGHVNGNFLTSYNWFVIGRWK